MDSPPPPYDETSSMLSSGATEVSALMTAAVRPPEYSACLDPEVAPVEHIPSCLGTSQRVIPDPLDCNESSLFSAHQSITILPGSFIISTRATHPLSSREVGPGCEDLDFPSSVSDTPPPPYETAMITLRPRPVESTWRDVTPCPDHVLSAVPFIPREDPSVNPLPMSGHGCQTMSGIHPPLANRISQSTPCRTSGEQHGMINLEDTVHRGGRILDQNCSFVFYLLFSIIIMVLFIYLFGWVK